VVRHLTEEGVLFDAQGRWNPALDLTRLDVPAGVRLVIERRLERLQPGTRRVLSLAAAVGLRFDLKLLQAAGPEDPDAVLDALEESAAARLVAPLSGRREPRYEFVHALVRETLLVAISPPRLRRLHLRVADAIEQVFAGSAEEHAAELAHHLFEAGPEAHLERLLGALRIAGDQALRAGAAEEALGIFDKAISLGPGTRDVGQILYKRGETRRTLGRWEEAASDWHAALAALESTGEAELVTRICWELAYQKTWGHDFEAAKILAERGLASAGEGASVGRCRLLAISGHAHNNAGLFERGDALLTEAIAMAEALGNDRLLGAEVLLSRTYQYQHTALPLRHIETSQRALALVRRVGSPWEISSALGASSPGLWSTARFEQALALCAEAEPLAARQGDLGTLIHMAASRGAVELSKGDLVGARSHFRQVTRMFRDAGFPWDTYALALCAGVAALQGDWQGAAAELEEAVRRPLGGSIEGMERAFQMRFLALSGDSQGAAASLAELARRIPTPGIVNGWGQWYVLTASVETAAQLGQLELAAKLYPLVCELIAGGTITLPGEGLTEKIAAIAAASAQDWERAEHHFEKALRLATEIPFRPEQPEVRRWSAWMLLNRRAPGDSGRAGDLLGQARALYQQIGMPRHVELVDRMCAEGA
jgi:tetratricopeptide (TPR) repeat protein